MIAITNGAPVRRGSFLTEPEGLLAQPLIDEIQRLKQRRNALVLAHN